MFRVASALGGAASGAALALPLAVASAQESTDGVGGGVTTFGIGDWFGLGVRLGLVILVIWGAVAGMRWYVKRMNGGRGRGGMGALEVIETHALGPNRTLHLVRLGDRAVLVGATPERITSLLTVDDPEELRRLTETPDEAPVRLGARGMSSIFSSLGTGLVAMNARRVEMNARLQAQRAQQSAAQQPQDTVPARPRFAGVREVLQRAARASQSARTPRTGGRAARPEAPPSSGSLFERTLASAEAFEANSPARAMAGLRARSGYGQVAATPVKPSRPATTPSKSRDAQIADLQRAIAAARKNAG